MKAIYQPYKSVLDDQNIRARNVFVEECLVDGWMRSLELKYRALVVIEDTQDTNFDGGGSVWLDEPVVTLTVDGHQFESMLRQIPFFTPLLRRPVPVDRKHRGLVDCDYCDVPGNWWSVLLSAPLAERVADAFEQALADRKDECDDTWNEVRRRTSGIPNFRPSQLQ